MLVALKDTQSVGPAAANDQMAALFIWSEEMLNGCAEGWQAGQSLNLKRSQARAEELLKLLAH